MPGGLRVLGELQGRGAAGLRLQRVRVAVPPLGVGGLPLLLRDLRERRHQVLAEGDEARRVVRVAGHGPRLRVRVPLAGFGIRLSGSLLLGRDPGRLVPHRQQVQRFRREELRVVEEHAGAREPARRLAEPPGPFVRRRAAGDELLRFGLERRDVVGRLPRERADDRVLGIRDHRARRKVGDHLPQGLDLLVGIGDGRGVPEGLDVRIQVAGRPGVRASRVERLPASPAGLAPASPARQAPGPVQATAAAPSGRRRRAGCRSADRPQAAAGRTRMRIGRVMKPRSWDRRRRRCRLRVSRQTRPRRTGRR